MTTEHPIAVILVGTAVVLLYHVLLLGIAIWRLRQTMLEPLLARLDALDARHTEILVRVAWLEREVGDLRASYRRHLPSPPDAE